MRTQRLIAFAAACLALLGCAAAPRTTRLTASDFDEVSARIGESLRASPQMAERGAASPRWVIAMQKAQNLSSDLITESERWYLLERLRASFPVVSLARDKNLVFVIPAEHLRDLREENEMRGAGSERAPTHELTSTIRSLSRVAGLHRTDAYMIEYRLTEIDTGRLVWAGEFEFKRAAFGRAWD